MKTYGSTPAEQIVTLMKRIYDQGLTSLSGGNLSIFDEDNNFWITPTSIDKGNLRAEDIAHFNKTGEFSGNHRPSSEYPFHWAIYKARKDIRAIVHAHSPALIAFSIAGKVPNQRISPVYMEICGEIGFAPYAPPGSQRLGEVIAEKFAEGHNIVILENHGVVAGGPDLITAYQRMESLEFAARTAIQAQNLGKINYVQEEALINEWKTPQNLNPLKKIPNSIEIQSKREKLIEIIHRANKHHLLFSISGSASARIKNLDFLITPHGIDRVLLEPDDLVYVSNKQQEQGKTTSRMLALHSEIYKQHPDVQAIITAQAPYLTAFAITNTLLDTRYIPESYMLLRKVEQLSLTDTIRSPEKVAQKITKESPAVMIGNLGIVVTGENILKAYDRLEVSELTARSYIEAQILGGLKPINTKEIQRLNWL
ncbi:MAG: aldolase [Anaerolineaceae bacterium]|nr:aldolase [Anaerolineaceae bacterium]